MRRSFSGENEVSQQADRLAIVAQKTNAKVEQWQTTVELAQAQPIGTLAVARLPSDRFITEGKGKENQTGFAKRAALLWK